MPDIKYSILVVITVCVLLVITKFYTELRLESENNENVSAISAESKDY